MASGKGTVSKYLEEKYGAKVYRFSDTLRNILDILHIECNRANLSNLSSIIRQNFGEDAISKAIAESVKIDNNEVLVVDGARRPEDLKYLSEIVGFKLVFVEADMEKRYERIVKRGENMDDNIKTFEDFKKDHKREAEFQARELRNISDAVIDNNGDQENLYRQADGLIK